MSVDALLEASGLSDAVLLHALQPLIGCDGPLSCQPPDQPRHGQALPSPSSSASSSSISLTLPLPSAGILRLDQEQVSRRQVGGAWSSHLVPAQTYLKVDKDVAGTLERKRNYIHCLIVRTMKQEKEMHIDNLVFKVCGVTSPSLLGMRKKRICTDAWDRVGLTSDLG